MILVINEQSVGAVNYRSNYMWWQSISALMPVIVTADRKRPLGVHA